MCNVMRNKSYVPRRAVARCFISNQIAGQGFDFLGYFAPPHPKVVSSRVDR